LLACGLNPPPLLPGSSAIWLQPMDAATTSTSGSSNWEILVRTLMHANP
jgi:hypothetical protein